MKVHIREADRFNSGEMDLIVGRSMESLLETVPEFNSNPMTAREFLPEFTFEQMKDKIIGSAHDPHHQILVASDLYGEMLGHSIFSIKKDPDGITYGSFYNRFLAPEHRRFGIGSALLTSAEEWMQQQGANYGLAQTHVKNFMLHNFFRKHKYQMIGPKMARWPYFEFRKDW